MSWINKWHKDKALWSSISMMRHRALYIGFKLWVLNRGRNQNVFDYFLNASRRVWNAVAIPSLSLPPACAKPG